MTKLDVFCFHSSAWLYICCDCSPVVFTILSWLRLFYDRNCYIYIYIVVKFCFDRSSVVFTILWRLKFYRICRCLQVFSFDIFHVAPACHFTSLQFTSLSLQQVRSEQNNLASFRAGHDSGVYWKTKYKQNPCSIGACVSWIKGLALRCEWRNIHFT